MKWYQKGAWRERYEEIRHQYRFQEHFEGVLKEGKSLEVDSLEKQSFLYAHITTEGKGVGGLFEENGRGVQ